MTKEPADEQIQRDTDFLYNEWKSILQSAASYQWGEAGWAITRNKTGEVRIEGVGLFAKPTIRFDGWLVEDADD